MKLELNNLQGATEFIPSDKRCKTLKDPVFFESAFSKAANYFKTELLDPVNRNITNVIINEKQLFVVVIFGIKTVFWGKTLQEALELSGHTTENLPDNVFAFEFQSDRNWINYRYSLPDVPNMPRHLISGKIPCSMCERGLAKIISDPETYKFC